MNRPLTAQEKRRKEKYPNTKYYKFYNANPKGKITCDCVIRAISLAMDTDYHTIYNEMVAHSIKTGYFVSSPKNIASYLKAQGWTKNKQPRNLDNTKLTGAEWIDKLKNGLSVMHDSKIIANIGAHHIVAIIDHKIMDIWDSSDRCIGNYWTYEH